MNSLTQLPRIEYSLDELVFLKTDPDQLQRIVTGINIRPNGVSYALGLGPTESWHFEIEITRERDYVLATSG